MLPVSLVLLSALLHAAWNALLKREKNPRLAAVPVVAIAALLSTALAVATWTPMSSRAWIASLSAGAFEGAYFYTLGRALSVAPLGVVYTVSRGGALLVVWPISLVMLGERVRALGIVGTVLVATGLVVTARETPRAGEVTKPGIGFAVACAGAIAGYHLSYKVALSAGATPAGSVAVSMGLGVILNVALLDRAQRAEAVKLVGPAIVLAGILGGVSFLVFLYALSRGGAGAMLTLRNTSVIFALLFSLAIGERPPRLRWLGVALVALGAVLLSLP